MNVIASTLMVRSNLFPKGILLITPLPWWEGLGEGKLFDQDDFLCR